ncbi:MAG TPA: zinc-dependent metalloprotease, partial [Polyangiales bacterium]
LRVSDKRQYEPLDYDDDRFERFGYFRLTNEIDDRSTGAPDDPAHGLTDFRNYNMNRHNIWMKWHDDAGNPIPYSDRQVRKIVWYNTPELPAHLVQSSFDVVGQWNEVFMNTVRRMRGQALPTYPTVNCQTTDPDSYCYCETDPDTDQTINPTCAGKYDPFIPPDQYAAGTENPYDCYVQVPDDAKKIDMSDPALSDDAFNPWFGAHFVGSECVTILRNNTCNKASQAAQTDKSPPLVCEERGDLRYKFLSYVATPGTSFLGIATLRGDPVTGEIVAGDANIGGPALDQYRTSALQTYDLISGKLTDLQLEVGEDVRGYFENLGRVSLPPIPRADFNAASKVVNDQTRQEVDGHMKGIADRLTRLTGPDGRQAIYSDRKSSLIGTDIERRLVAGLDTQPDGTTVTESVDASGTNLTDAQLQALSPLRTTIQQRLSSQKDREDRYSRANVEIGNEYTDDSVQWFVSRHQDWTRTRLEFEINRLLYRQTVLHEMGHCLGLRHDFGASADSMHYRDEYYEITRRYPLPDAASFDKDGTPGLSRDESLAYETEYDSVRSKRELAGIDGAMSSSVMEYTANWYERLQPLGKYDAAAIAFGYGEMAEAYQGAPAGDAPRTMIRYYQGGEACQSDSDCPYSAGGPHAADLLDTNMNNGITQHCVQNPRTPDAMLCSSSDDDLTAQASQGGALSPLTYRFCTDERADSTLAWCSRFDEGDSYRDIVRNIEDSYDRMYVFSAFRRYRSDFSANTYADALLGRRLNI